VNNLEAGKYTITIRIGDKPLQLCAQETTNRPSQALTAFSAWLVD
jgi:hypothetical protein